MQKIYFFTVRGSESNEFNYFVHVATLFSSIRSRRSPARPMYPRGFLAIKWWRTAKFNGLRRYIELKRKFLLLLVMRDVRIIMPRCVLMICTRRKILTARWYLKITNNYYVYYNLIVTIVLITIVEGADLRPDLSYLIFTRRRETALSRIMLWFHYT